jgi:uncharacterized repeat protein (TIGR01451 family)
LPGGERAYAAAAELNGRIYVVGGWENQRTVEVYDPATARWSTAAPMEIGRQSPGLAVAPDGYLYVSGGGDGWQGLDSAERYDPATDTWQFIPSLIFGDRAGTAAAYAAGQIWTVGGVGWDGLTNANESLRLFDDFCHSSKSVWQDAVQPGGRITYTVEIASTAVDPTHANLVDPIPAGTTFAGFGPNRAGATYDSVQNQVRWSGTIPARSSPLTFTFGVNVDSHGWTHGSPVTNVAAFSDGSGRVFTRTQVSLVEFPDASPSAKRVNEGQAVAGEALTYTIRVENPSTLSGTFSLRDPIPTGTSYVPGSLASTLGAGGYSPAQQAITWTGRLPGTYTYANTSGNYEWGDSLRHGTVPGVGFDWVEINNIGTPISFGDLDDSYFYPIVLPFPFSFYGTPYTDLAVATNGTVYFEDTRLGWMNWPIPHDNTGYAVNTFIAPLWDDLYVFPGTVYYEVRGSAPNRRVVIEYHQVSGCCLSPDNGTWEVILYENGAILMQYLGVTFGDAHDYGALATVGIQDSPTQGLQYSYNTLALSDGLAIVFLPPGASWGGETHYADVTFAVRTGLTWPVNAWLTNTATITGPYGPLQRSAGTRINSVDLSGSVKTADEAEAVLGEVVRYTLLLKHDGLLNATGVTLTDPIPPGLTYVPGSLTYTLGTARYNTATNAITWTGTLLMLSQHSAEVSFAVTLTTLLRDSAPVTNVAHLNDGYGNLYELEAAFVARESGLSASFKQADPVRVLPGGAVTYTIYVRNTGNILLSSQAQDTLPPELTYEPGSLVCGSGSCTYGAGRITWTGTILPRSMVPVRFRARVPANAAHGDRITNTAIVSDTASGFAYPVLATVTVVVYPDENDRFLPLVMRH